MPDDNRSRLLPPSEFRGKPNIPACQTLLYAVEKQVGAFAMSTDRLRDDCQSQPFRPFTMHLADGRQIPVLHREFVMSSPSGRTVVVYQPDDSLNIIDMLLVTDFDLEMKPNGLGQSLN